MWFLGFIEKHSWTREVKSIVKAQHDNRQQKQLGWFRVTYTPLSVFSVYFVLLTTNFAILPPFK